MSKPFLSVSIVLISVGAFFLWHSRSKARFDPVCPARDSKQQVPEMSPSNEIEPHHLAVETPTGRIVFTSYRSGNASGIFSMAADGSDVTSLTYGGSSAGSPDGRRLACVQFFNDTGRFEIVLLEPSGRFAGRLTKSSEEDSTSPAWSRDGKRIAFQSGDFNKPSIYVMNADGSGRKRITPPKGNDRNPRFSPDGKWIAFSSYRDGKEGVYLINADGEQVRRVTEKGTACSHPVWSPDGKYLAYVAYIRKGRRYHLRIKEVKSGDWWNVLEDQDRIVSPSWSQTGNWLTFGMTANKNTDIFIVNARGEGLRNLTNHKSTDTDPTWMTTAL